jgi:hypothetical protein
MNCKEEPRELYIYCIMEFTFSVLHCEYDIEESGYIEGGKFLEQLKDYQIFKKNSSPYS